MKNSSEKNNYSWSIFVRCTGKENFNNQIPCGESLNIKGNKLVKFLKDDFWVYGFICPKCGCFTRITTNIIPPEIKKIADLIKNN